MVRFLVLFLLASHGSYHHPVHVSVATVDMDTGSGEITVTIKLFSDDFETIVNHRFNTSLALSRQIDPGGDMIFINRYINDRFGLTVNGEKITELNYLKNQMNEEAIWLFYDCSCEKEIRSVKIHNSLMNDLFPDQTNLVIVTWADKQSGYRLNGKTNEISINL